MLCMWLVWNEPPLEDALQKRCPGCESLEANLTATLKAFVKEQEGDKYENNDVLAVLGHAYRSYTKLDFSEGKYGGLSNLWNGARQTPSTEGIFPEWGSVLSAPVVAICGLHMLVVWQHESSLLKLMASFFVANGIGAFGFHFTGSMFWGAVDGNSLRLAVWFAVFVLLSEFVEKLDAIAPHVLAIRLKSDAAKRALFSNNGLGQSVGRARSGSNKIFAANMLAQRARAHQQENNKQVAGTEASSFENSAFSVLSNMHVDNKVNKFARKLRKQASGRVFKPAPWWRWVLKWVGVDSFGTPLSDIINLGCYRILRTTCDLLAQFNIVLAVLSYYLTPDAHKLLSFVLPVVVALLFAFALLSLEMAYGHSQLELEKTLLQARLVNDFKLHQKEAQSLGEEWMKHFMRAFDCIKVGLALAVPSAGIWIIVENFCDVFDVFKWFPGHVLWHAGFSIGMTHLLAYLVVLRADNNDCIAIVEGGLASWISLPLAKLWPCCFDCSDTRPSRRGEKRGPSCPSVLVRCVMTPLLRFCCCCCCHDTSEAAEWRPTLRRPATAKVIASSDSRQIKYERLHIGAFCQPAVGDRVRLRPAYHDDHEAGDDVEHGVGGGKEREQDALLAGAALQSEFRIITEINLVNQTLMLARCDPNDTDIDTKKDKEKDQLKVVKGDVLEFYSSAGLRLAIDVLTSIGLFMLPRVTFKEYQVMAGRSNAQVLVTALVQQSHYMLEQIGKSAAFMRHHRINLLLPYESGGAERERIEHDFPWIGSSNVYHIRSSEEARSALSSFCMLGDACSGIYQLQGAAEEACLDTMKAIAPELVEYLLEWNDPAEVVPTLDALPSRVLDHESIREMLNEAKDNHWSSMEEFKTLQAEAGKKHEGRLMKEAARDALERLTMSNDVSVANRTVEKLKESRFEEERCVMLMNLAVLEAKALEKHAPVFVKVLEDESPKVRGRAVLVLDKLADDTKRRHAESVLKLVENAQAEDPGYRVSAVDALCRMQPNLIVGRPIDACVALLDSDKMDRRATSLLMVAKAIERTKTQPTAEALLPKADAVCEMYNQDQMDVRVAVLRTLARLESKDLAKYSERIVAMLNDQSWQVREPAADAIRLLDLAERTKHASAIAGHALAASGYVRLMVAEVLGTLGVEELTKHASAVAKVLSKEVSDCKLTQVNLKRVKAAILTLGMLEVSVIESACREARVISIVGLLPIFNLTPSAVDNLLTSIERIRKDAQAQKLSPAEDAEWQAAVDKVQQVVVPPDRRRKPVPPVLNHEDEFEA